MIAWARYPFSDAVVLVTGGGTGIGRAAARAFLEQGARVAVVGRTQTDLDEAVATYDATRALTIRADLTDQSEVGRTVRSVVAQFGRLDVVIASAGISESSRSDTIVDDVWERVRSINLDSFIWLVRHCVPHLQASQGNVVAVSSISGIRGEWQLYAYTATKAAVNVAVQSFALDLGPKGVRVNAVAPGFTHSRLTQQRLEDPVFHERLLDRIALGRVAAPEDIARAILFVASPDAGYVTGAVIPVDGGVTASSGTPRPV